MSESLGVLEKIQDRNLKLSQISDSSGVPAICIGQIIKEFFFVFLP